MKQEFLKELKALLKKYDAKISFTCSDSSDTHGLYNDHLQIKIKNEVIAETDGWILDKTEI